MFYQLMASKDCTDLAGHTWPNLDLMDGSRCCSIFDVLFPDFKGRRSAESFGLCSSAFLCGAPGPSCGRVFLSHFGTAAEDCARAVTRDCSLLQS